MRFIGKGELAKEQSNVKGNNGWKNLDVLALHLDHPPLMLFSEVLINMDDFPP